MDKNQLTEKEISQLNINKKYLEDELSGLRQNPLNMILKNVFYFTLKTLFVLEIFKFLS